MIPIAALPCRQGKEPQIWYTRRTETKKTPLPRTITPAKKIPRPPGLKPGASTPPRPPRPPPTDRPSSFKNRFPGPTGPLPKRTVRPSVSRAQPQPQQARPADDWPARAPICDWSFELSLRRLVIRSRREVAAARLWPPFLDGRFFGDGKWMGMVPCRDLGGLICFVSYGVKQESALLCPSTFHHALDDGAGGSEFDAGVVSRGLGRWRWDSAPN